MNMLATFNHLLLTPSQVYFGYEMEDALRLVRYGAKILQPAPGYFTDYFGIRTRLSHFTQDHFYLDQTVGGFPFPNDGLHSELVEYLGTAQALEAAGKNVTVVEMGAGYGPWLVFSSLVARKLGAHSVQMVAVEADAERHTLIRTHFNDNGFPPPEIVHAAISDQRGTVSFGSGSVHDWGGAVQTDAGTDYRGAQVAQLEVPSLLMSDVLDPLGTVDLLHIDIQGWEAKAMRASLDSVCAKVRYMVIGTHSRVIEGELIDMLRGRGWTLMHEKPCQFTYAVTPELTGATTVDGAQVWANTALGAPTDVPPNLTVEELALVEKTREKVGFQHRIAKEYVWTLQDRIAELEKIEARVSPWLRKLVSLF